jgi:peroxiredoxin
MERHGGRLIAICVDPVEDNARVVKEDGLAFPVLSDASRATITAYGIVHRHGGVGGTDIAIPTHVLVAPDGRILWSRSAPRIQDRLSADAVIAILREHLGG